MARVARTVRVDLANICLVAFKLFGLNGLSGRTVELSVLKILEVVRGCIYTISDHSILTSYKPLTIHSTSRLISGISGRGGQRCPEK